jgi:DNA-binding IclR family transcriptional regulator
MAEDREDKNEIAPRTEEETRAIIEKYNAVVAEIVHKGWDRIRTEYHPDVNCDNPNSFNIFQMYKEVYLVILNKCTIK